MIFSWQSHHNSHTTLQLSWTLEMGQPCRFNVLWQDFLWQRPLEISKPLNLTTEVVWSFHEHLVGSIRWLAQVIILKFRNRTSSFCSHHDRTGFSGSVCFASVRSCSVYQRTVETCQVHSHATFQPNWYVYIYMYISKSSKRYVFDHPGTIKHWFWASVFVFLPVLLATAGVNWTTMNNSQVHQCFARGEESSGWWYCSMLKLLCKGWW